jgi:hypothetical protein
MRPVDKRMEHASPLPGDGAQARTWLNRSTQGHFPGGAGFFLRVGGTCKISSRASLKPARGGAIEEGPLVVAAQ